MAEKIVVEKFEWGTRQLEVDKLFIAQFAQIRLWYKINSEELWIAHQSLDPGMEELADLESTADDLKWSRWAFKKAPKAFQIMPIFPNRSVVAKPEHPFKVATRAQAMIYVRVPVWLRLEMAKKELETLKEIPTVVLSNTWFGTFTDGELCYWLSTKARREIAADPENPHLVICPLRIINSSEEELLVEKLRLQVRGLSIYQSDGQLWADETKISFRGHNDVSRIEIISKKPDELKEFELLSPPREDIKKGLAARTFTSITSLPGFDLFR